MDTESAKEYVKNRRETLDKQGVNPINSINLILSELAHQHRFLCWVDGGFIVTGYTEDGVYVLQGGIDG
jgi:hypothetical protein